MYKAELEIILKNGKTLRLVYKTGKTDTLAILDDIVKMTDNPNVWLALEDVDGVDCVLKMSEVCFIEVTKLTQC